MVDACKMLRVVNVLGAVPTAARPLTAAQV